ncbi:hypothetical protein HNV12_16270 [Methanococcoides sp. SA1]|nr:hypothetical protein [Methanococcoides sp. SA1]
MPLATNEIELITLEKILAAVTSTCLFQASVTESLADFIQGRAATTVGSAHYLNKVQRASVEYAKIIDQFPI